MLNLNYSYQTNVEKAYIVTIKGNEKSERYSLRCQESCKKVGMEYEVWDAFDGTGEGIKTPDRFKNESIFNILKVTDHYKTKSEIACTLSHFSLWLECAKIDKPIVVLEHDAILIKKFETFNHFNSIVYLGCIEWAKRGWPMSAIPLHGSDGNNYHFLLRTHSYAVDPTMAKNLIAHCIKYGITAAPDYLVRADIFNITHQGLYAYDDMPDHEQNTTITNRKMFDNSNRKRNDGLIY